MIATSDVAGFSLLELSALEFIPGLWFRGFDSGRRHDNRPQPAGKSIPRLKAKMRKRTVATNGFRPPRF